MSSDQAVPLPEQFAGVGSPAICAVFTASSKKMRPGKLVALWRRAGREQLVWPALRVRRSLAWWGRKGGELVDIPASHFAERPERDQQLRWDEVPQGQVLRGLIDPHDGQPLLKVVSRASTDAELAALRIRACLCFPCHFSALKPSLSLNLRAGKASCFSGAHAAYKPERCLMRVIFSRAKSR